MSVIRLLYHLFKHLFRYFLPYLYYSYKLRNLLHSLYSVRSLSWFFMPPVSVERYTICYSGHVCYLIIFLERYLYVLYPRLRYRYFLYRPYEEGMSRMLEHFLNFFHYLHSYLQVWVLWRPNPRYWLDFRYLRPHLYQLCRYRGDSPPWRVGWWLRNHSWERPCLILCLYLELYNFLYRLIKFGYSFFIELFPCNFGVRNKCLGLYHLIVNGPPYESLYERVNFLVFRLVFMLLHNSLYGFHSRLDPIGGEHCGDSVYWPWVRHKLHNWPLSIFYYGFLYFLIHSPFMPFRGHGQRLLYFFSY